MQKKNILAAVVILFIITGTVAYFSGLFIDVTRDAGKYATVSKEIYQNGNFINLTVHDEPYDQKPPLLFWMGAAGFAIGGVSNFWFKFPVFLLVLAGIYWAFKLGESLYDRKTGMVTALLLFSSFIYSLYSMDIHTDTPLQAFVALALWQLFVFIKLGRTRNMILGFVAIGLAMLSKGPVGAAIPAFAVVGHLFMQKDFKRLLDYRWYVGIVISFIIVSPALIGLMNQFGWEGIRFFFWENMVGRITGSYVKAVNDPIFYVHNLLYQLLPWSLLFFIAVFMEFRQLIKNRFSSHEFFTLFGIWIYFIILNSASSQLPNYVFSIVPLMAVLLAKWIMIAIRENSFLYRLFLNVQHVVIILVWIGIFGISGYLFPGAPVYFWMLAAAGLIATVYILTQPFERPVKLLVPSAIVSFLLMFLLNIHVYKYIFSYQAPPEAARYFTLHAEEGDILYNYRYGQYEQFFYSEPQAVHLHYNREAMKIVAGEIGNWIFTDEKGYMEIQDLDARADTVVTFRHLDLSRGGRFINPKTRNEVLENMYLIKF
jgi:4-amino-4-deoxy-L-arabinose transferase-like glycosyltransferase